MILSSVQTDVSSYAFIDDEGVTRANLSIGMGVFMITKWGEPQPVVFADRPLIDGWWEHPEFLSDLSHVVGEEVTAITGERGQ